MYFVWPTFLTLRLVYLATNSLAISMYEKFGYVTYRRVLGYYSGDDVEDALDMRKALPRDKHKQSMIPLDKPVLPEDLEW